MIRDEDEAIVDAVLGENNASPALRATLLDLRSLARQPAPTPSPELLAAMSPTVTVLSTRRARTILAVGIGSIIAITAGVGSAAAANPEFREAIETTVTKLVETVSGGSENDGRIQQGDSTETGSSGSSTDDTSSPAQPTPTPTPAPPGADNFPSHSNTHAPDTHPGKGTPGGGSSHGNSNNGKSGSHPTGKPTQHPSGDD
jgi:hypothetical protein